MAEQKIVTLVDASVYAESVCDHASWAAQRLEAPVELLHVIGRRQEPTNLGQLVIQATIVNRSQTTNLLQCGIGH